MPVYPSPCTNTVHALLRPRRTPDPAPPRRYTIEGITLPTILLRQENRLPQRNQALTPAQRSPTSPPHQTKHARTYARHTQLQSPHITKPNPTNRIDPTSPRAYKLKGPHIDHHKSPTIAQSSPTPKYGPTRPSETGATRYCSLAGRVPGRQLTGYRPEFR